MSHKIGELKGTKEDDQSKIDGEIIGDLEGNREMHHIILIIGTRVGGEEMINGSIEHIGHILMIYLNLKNMRELFKSVYTIVFCYLQKSSSIDYRRVCAETFSFERLRSPMRGVVKHLIT